VAATIAFLLEDLARDLVAGDLADVIADLDRAAFAPRVLFLTGRAAELPSDLRSALAGETPLHGPLRRPFWNVGLIRRALLAMGTTKPAVVVAAGRGEVLDLAPRLIRWIERPAVYLAPSGDPELPWGRRAALDTYAKIVATTGRLTLRLVDELRVAEARVATIYPGIDTDRFAWRAIETAQPALVGLVGAPRAASAAALAAALATPAAGASAMGDARPIRLAAPRAAPPLVDVGPSWTPEALARVSLLLCVPDSEWESAYAALLRGMAVGRAVLAAVPAERLDGLVVDGETGCLVADAAPPAVAAAVRALVALPDLLESMGIAARMRIVGEFGRARRLSEFEALLRVVAGIPFPPPTLPSPPAPSGQASVQFKPLQ
jgi:hypothetical protein